MANAQTNDRPEFLTTAQVAKAVQVHPETIRRMIKAGTLKAVRWQGRSNYRVARSEFERLVREAEQ